MATEGLYHNFRRRPKVVVEANHYSIWELSQTDYGFILELSDHINEYTITLLCGQFPITADYDGEGTHGTRICLYR